MLNLAQLINSALREGAARKKGAFDQKSELDARSRTPLSEQNSAHRYLLHVCHQLLNSVMGFAAKDLYNKVLLRARPSINATALALAFSLSLSLSLFFFKLLVLSLSLSLSFPTVCDLEAETTIESIGLITQATSPFKSDV